MSICICNPHAEPESETMPNCPIHGVKAMSDQSKHAPDTGGAAGHTRATAKPLDAQGVLPGGVGKVSLP